MNQDLQDLLAFWLGDHDPGPVRRAALLERLRADAEFRRGFVEEIRMLGMLRAVQSSEPRWLRLEDEVGWSARQQDDVETFASKVVQEGRRRLRTRRLVRWSGRIVGVAAAAVVAACLVLALRPAAILPPSDPPGTASGKVEVATLIRAEDVRWEPGSDATPAEGEVVAAGRLRLKTGRLTLAFFSGTSLTVEGPADLELLAADRVFCHLGKLRARVPHGAEGFTVRAAGYEVVDLGTEFGLNLEPGGKSRVMVFEGAAAVSVLGKDGRSVRGALLEGKRRSVEVDPDAGHIHEVPAHPTAFVPLGRFEPAPLELDPSYPDAIRAARPWGYWRFEALADGRIPNEVEGRPALRALGGVTLERSPGGNHWARFGPNNPAQAFLMDGAWSPPRADGYAIEMWVQADLPSPGAFSQTALVGLIDQEGDSERHLAYLELTARGRRSPHEPCAIRFLDRWPAAVHGGADVFSRRSVVTSQWHHVVAQKSGDVLQLYLNGECVGTTPAKQNAEDEEEDATAPCRLLVGRLKQRRQHPAEVRAFEGRLDEFAVYDRPLTPGEIRRHARLRAANLAS
jgi:hypothetical protein